MQNKQSNRARRPRLTRSCGEQGAGLVEFSLLLPLFFILVLGIFTGGIAYNRKISLTHAAREASRFGATLPVSNFGAAPVPLESWLDAVAAVAVDSAGGELNAGGSGREICVAYVHPAGINPNDVSYSREETNSGVTRTPGDTCFDDGRPATERRVQVLLRRTGKLDAFVFSMTLNLSSSSLTRFEAAP